MILPAHCSLFLKRCDLTSFHLYESCTLTHQFLVWKDGRNMGGGPLKPCESLIEAYFLWLLAKCLPLFFKDEHKGF